MFVCIPVGPLGFLSIQRTIKDGRMIGFLSGVGAALSDAIYSSIAIFGISFIDEIIEKYDLLIKSATGLLFLAMGIYIISKSGNSGENIGEIEDNRGRGGKIANAMVPTFIMGLSNPMTFFIFMAVFAKMGIKLDASAFGTNIGFAFSILVGSCLLWVIVTNIIKLSKKGFGIKTIMFIDKAIGGLICGCGIFNLVKVIAKI